MATIETEANIEETLEAVVTKTEATTIIMAITIM